MKEIVLNKGDKKTLSTEFFSVKSGKLIARDVLENGKVIPHENYLHCGDIIGNFLTFFPIFSFEIKIPNIIVELEALEDDTVIEEIELDKDTINSNPILSNIIKQLMKKYITKFFFQLYSRKAYILLILKLYQNERGFLHKSDINCENFNTSQSQFYKLYTELKKEKFVIENCNLIFLDNSKIDNYLFKNHN